MFKLDVHNLAIEDDLFVEDEMQSYPGIAWHGKFEGDRESGGFFTLDVDAVEGVPEGWERATIQYGTDPNAEPVDVYQTRALRCVPVGVRKRIIITDDLDEQHYYPWMTAKRNRVAGKFTAHYQVMVMLPGTEEPCVIGLRGLTKTTSWDNDVKGRYRNDNFATGVEQLLKLFAQEASKANKYPMPPLCLWQIVLQPLKQADGKPLFVSVGSGDQIAHMNPFTAQMHPANPAYINAEFVGAEPFAQYQTLRQETAMAWEKAWKDAASMTSIVGQAAEPTTPKPVAASSSPTFGIEDDIPF